MEAVVEAPEAGGLRGMSAKTLEVVAFWVSSSLLCFRRFEELWRGRNQGMWHRRINTSRL